MVLGTRFIRHAFRHARPSIPVADGEAALSSATFVLSPCPPNVELPSLVDIEADVSDRVQSSINYNPVQTTMWTLHRTDKGLPGIAGGTAWDHFTTSLPLEMPRTEWSFIPSWAEPRPLRAHELSQTVTRLEEVCSLHNEGRRHD